MTVDTLLTSPVIQLTPHLSHLPFLMENVDWALCLQFLFCQHLCRAAKPCSNVSWLSRLPPCPSQHGEFAPTGAPGGAPLRDTAPQVQITQIKEGTLPRAFTSALPSNQPL